MQDWCRSTPSSSSPTTCSRQPGCPIDGLLHGGCARRPGTGPGTLVEYDQAGQDLHEPIRPSDGGLCDGTFRLMMSLAGEQVPRGRTPSQGRDVQHGRDGRGRGGRHSVSRLTPRRRARRPGDPGRRPDRRSLPCRGSGRSWTSWPPRTRQWHRSPPGLRDHAHHLHLERIGDMAVNIAKMARAPGVVAAGETVLSQIQEMSDVVRPMIRASRWAPARRTWGSSSATTA